MIRNIVITIFSAAIMFACSEKEQAPAPGGSVKLGYRVDKVQLKSGFAGDTAIPTSKPKQLVITVHDSNGKPVLNGERYDLIKIGDEYYSKSILFKTGEYTLEEFIVVDSTDEAMYVAPKSGSRLAGFVDDPLPQSFEVKKDSESEVMVQVVPAYLASASDFGYASFPFEVVMPATGVKHLGLCGTYEEDKKRLDACFDSKECLLGKWRFEAFIDTDSCLVEYTPDTIWNKPVGDSWLSEPWLQFYENDSLAGESVTNEFRDPLFGQSITKPMYEIDEHNSLRFNYFITMVNEPEWGIRFRDALRYSQKFISFKDTLFLYNTKSKMLFVKIE